MYNQTHLSAAQCNASLTRSPVVSTRCCNRRDEASISCKRAPLTCVEERGGGRRRQGVREGEGGSTQRQDACPHQLQATYPSE